MLLNQYKNPMIKFAKMIKFNITTTKTIIINAKKHVSLCIGLSVNTNDSEKKNNSNFYNKLLKQ